MDDLYWCGEGCGFVDKNHRCEQWCHIYRIPGEAIASIRAEARAEAARELPEYGWQKRFRDTYGIPWNRALSNREAQLHDACKLGWELARAAILADEPKEELGSWSNPYKGTFNPVCFQRHDSALRLGVCERDFGFELVIHGTSQESSHYAIHQDASVERLDEPKEERGAEGPEDD